jgi:hypothetical protein
VLFPSPARPATIIFREIMRGDNFIDSGDPIEYDGDVAPLSLTEGVSLATGLFQVEEASAKIMVPPPNPRQQTINGNKENIGIVVSSLEFINCLPLLNISYFLRLYVCYYLPTGRRGK